jgi:co-chaperonin GroES (HSP10)
MSTPFKPQAGYIITTPYTSKDATFVSDKETDGWAGISEVLAVGEEYIDDHGNLRQTKVKKGDIILHLYSQNTFEEGFTKYRAVHFSQVIGIK